MHFKLGPLKIAWNYSVLQNAPHITTQLQLFLSYINKELCPRACLSDAFRGTTLAMFIVMKACVSSDATVSLFNVFLIAFGEQWSSAAQKLHQALVTQAATC